MDAFFGAYALGLGETVGGEGVPPHSREPTLESGKDFWTRAALLSTSIFNLSQREHLLVFVLSSFRPSGRLLIRIY